MFFDQNKDSIMANTITDNPFVKQLFDTKEQNPNNKPGLDISELAKAKNQADVTFEPTMAAARMAHVERAYQYSETMSLQLTTREGDTVSVDFRQLYAQYQSYKETQIAEQDPQGVRYFESKEAMEMTQFEERFAFSVEGDLNEDELQAVFDVFEKVDSLANQFFEGNIEKALEQAMELDINMEQLSGMKLNLTQTETLASSYQQAAVAQYSDVQQAGENEESAEEYGVTMADLPPYLQSWQEALDSLEERFVKSQEFLNEFMGDVTAQRFPDQDSRLGWLDRVEKFHEQLAEMAKLNSPESAEVNAAEDSDEALPEAQPANQPVV